MTRRLQPRPRGFTLVEMLVVVAIIGILAAIITPALYNAVLRARENRIAQEVSQIHQGFESYKQAFGDYPPDFTDSSLGTSSVVVRHLRKAFPRHTEDKGSSPTPLEQLLAAQLTRTEAIVFCLSQICNDPRQPLSSTSAEPKVFFTFDQARLIPTRSITLGSRTLQLYAYVPRDGGETPYVFFDSRTYAANLLATGGFTINGETVRPYKRKISGAYQFANPTTYQIISAGLDAEFGTTSATNAKCFPEGVVDTTNNIEAYTEGDRDNITNFSDGRTLKENVP